MGALSDWTRQRSPVWGGRRVYMVAGQLVTVAGLAIMFVASSFWPLTIGFSLMNLGMSIGYGAYPSLLPELVPVAQVGAASGWVGFFQQGGLLFGSLTGFAAGQGWINQLTTGWGLIVRPPCNQLYREFSVTVIFTVLYILTCQFCICTCD